jgi:hypothetical protein
MEAITRKTVEDNNPQQMAYEYLNTVWLEFRVQALLWLLSIGDLSEDVTD